MHQGGSDGDEVYLVSFLPSVCLLLSSSIQTQFSAPKRFKVHVNQPPTSSYICNLSQNWEHVWARSQSLRQPRVSVEPVFLNSTQAAACALAQVAIWSATVLQLKVEWLYFLPLIMAATASWSVKQLQTIFR